MQERRVEVAVGLTDHTWREVWVNVPEDPDHVLDDDETSTKAHDIAMTLAIQAGQNVSFIYVIYVEPVGDDLDGIV
jgi:hypothetical protein